LGGTKTIPIDVRLVAAINRNLTQMMGDKLYRSDLYYRLKWATDQSFRARERMPLEAARAVMAAEADSV